MEVPAARDLVEVLVPQIWEDIGEVVSLFPQERVQQRIDEQIDDVPLREDVSTSR